MCGFLVSKNGRGNDKFIRRRGMDRKNTYVRHGLRFDHFLLHVTGEVTTQPFIDGDVVCVYNGEIYNLPFVKSDGENIIPAYRGHAEFFPADLDGEFAIALYDFAEGFAYFVT